MPIARNLLRCYEISGHALKFYRAHLERMLGANSPVSQEDQMYLAEAAPMQITSYWEESLEKLMLLNVYHEIHGTRNIPDAPDPTQKDLESCNDQIAGKGKFFNCSNADRLITISERFLPEESNPFDALRTYEEPVRKIYTFRNYLAHRGLHSREALSGLYKRKYQRTEWIRPGELLHEGNGALPLSFLTTIETALQDMKDKNQE